MAITLSKLLSLALLLPALCLPARAQASQTRNKRTETRPAPQTRPAEDELARQLGAAESFQLSGDLERAAAANRAVASIALRRLGAFAIRGRDYRRATRLLNDSLALRDDAAARTDLAIAHMRLLEVEQAMTEARAAIALDEKNARSHHVLGKLLYMKADYAAALPHMERAVLLEPDLDAAYTLGMTYLRVKQLERARLLFEEMQTALDDSPQAHTLFGRAYQETGYSAEAEREFKRAVAIDPRAPRAHFYLAYVILLHGGSERLKDAAAEFERELELSPKDYYSHLFRGLIAAGDGDHTKAVRHLSEATRVKPESGEAHLYLGQSLAELNDPSAEKILRRAIVLTPDVSQHSFQVKRAHFLLGRILIKTNRRAEGERELAIARELQGQSLESTRQEVSAILGQVVNPSNAVNQSNDVSAPSRVVAASSTAKDGEPKSAAPTDDDVILLEESAPDSQEATRYERAKAELAAVLAQAYHNLGVIAVQQGRPAEGVARFAAAAEWKPDLPGLDRNWGIVSFRAAEYAKAVQPLSRHLQSQPSDALARRMLGVSHYLTGNFKQAVETLRPLEASITDDAELAYAYGVSLARLADVKAATVLFTRLAERHARAPQARLYAAQGFMMIADYDGALREYRAAARLDPAAEKAHFNAGLSLIRLNRLDEAEQEFRQELSLHPSDEASKYHLAYVLLELKQKTAEAVSLLRQAIAARPDYADARYRLGKALVEQGDVPGAIEHLEAAARAEPSKDYIRYQLSIAYRRASRAADAERELQLYRELKAASRSREAQQPPGAMGDKPHVP